MASPLIAVVGSCDPARTDELALKNVAVAQQAGEDVGRELARQGCRIVVYSSDAHTLELPVVRGYVSHKNVEPGSIQVLFWPQYGQPSFPEEKGNEETFDFRPDLNMDWEFSFYQSLAKVDGMFLLGGGQSALIAGLVALGHRKPLLPCAGFGGAGDKIWRTIRLQEYPLTDAEFALMARSNWSAEFAVKLVALLQTQKERFTERERILQEEEDARVEERRAQELRENATINYHAVISAVLFAAAAFSWPLAGLIPADNPWLPFFVLFTPILAGASGATIRVVLDWATGVTRTLALSAPNQFILLRYAALGIVAGGLAGVSFVLAQLFASGHPSEALGPATSRLAPFLVIIGFAAGLTAEVVLSNLRKSGAPTIEIPLKEKKSS